MNTIICGAKLLVLALFAFSALAEGDSRAEIYEVPPVAKLLDATGFGGVVLVYDLEKRAYFAGHRELADERSIPASTFKIFSSLVALETGVISGSDAVVKWDGVERERGEINRDLDLQSAFRLSAVPHYQELVREIGRIRMQQYVDAVGYGNRDLSGAIDSFWLRGELRISPREQIEFLMRLRDGDLLFSQEVMATVKAMMVVEDAVDQTIRAKTGWAILDETKNTGWWVGWMERSGRTYFFATVLLTTAPDQSFGPARIEVTQEALELLAAPAAELSH